MSAALLRVRRRPHVLGTEFYRRGLRELVCYADDGMVLWRGAGPGSLCVGRDSGEPVTGDYPGDHPHTFTSGTIKRVAVDVSGEPYVNLEREA